MKDLPNKEFKYWLQPLMTYTKTVSSEDASIEIKVLQDIDIVVIVLVLLRILVCPKFHSINSLLAKTYPYNLFPHLYVWFNFLCFHVGIRVPGKEVPASRPPLREFKKFWRRCIFQDVQVLGTSPPGTVGLKSDIFILVK